MRLLELTRSASFRTAASYALLFALSVAIIFAVVYQQTSVELSDQLTDDVKRDTDDLILLYQASGSAALQQQIATRTRSTDPDAPMLALRDARGRLLAGDARLANRDEGWSEYQPRPHKPGTAPLEKAGRYMVLGTSVGDDLLVVGHAWQPIEEVNDVLAKGFMIGAAITVLLALVGGIGMSIAASRRFEAVTSAINEIIDGNLRRRLPLASVRDDFDLLVAAINRMLERIQSLMENFEQVSNDIAHDLRTPLGRLRHDLEAARSNPLQYEAALDRGLEKLDAILDTFSALLRIAQIGSGERRSHFSSFDLSELTRMVVDSFEAVAESEHQRLLGRVTAGISLIGDRELIAQALVNLVENAIRHSPRQTLIEVSLTREVGLDHQQVVLTVGDTGPGIPVDEREKVLQRLYRVDRSRTTPGNGLGLALAKAVTDLHRADLVLEDNAPGLRVSLRFPDQDPFPSP